MKKETKRKEISKAKESSVRKETKKKKPVKLQVTGNTEILDFDLLEDDGEEFVPKREKKRPPKRDDYRESRAEKEPKKASKPAVKSREGSGRKMEYVPESKKRREAVNEETVEIWEADADWGKREESARMYEREELASRKKKPASQKPPQKKGHPQKRTGGRSEFGAMDVVIALTGVIVLFVAVAAFGIYRNASDWNRQVEAMAQVGEKLETIGIAGDAVFVAVADARLAAQELGDLPEQPAGPVEEGGDGYEEKELESKISVAMKLSSVQKDLKIKFTNKETGKLIGNQPFAVSIEGPEKLTKTDEDRDGIIYINSITAGEYTVTITAPDTIDGAKAAGTQALVTVKNTIEYKKIDVTDEVKKESEINTAKEDTAVAPPVESVAKDTVEWVESTKTPVGAGDISYEEIKKGDIPDPSVKAGLDRIWTADGRGGAYLQDTVRLSQNAGTFAPKAVKALEKGMFFTQESIQDRTADVQPSTETEQPPQESTTPPETESGSGEGGETKPSEPPVEKPEFAVKSVSLSGQAECTQGDTVTLTANVETEGEGSLSDSDYSWSGAQGAGNTARFSAESAGSYTVTVTVRGVSASTTITVREKAKPVEVSGISVSASPSRLAVGQSATVTATVSMSDGSAYSGSVEWSASGGQVSGSGTSVTVTSAAAQKVTVTAKAGGQQKGVEIEFYAADKKVTRIGIPESVTVLLGQTAVLAPTVEPADAKEKGLDWKVTEGADIASVDANGTVKGLKVGTAKICAAARDGSNVSSNVCTVTVAVEVGASMEAPGSIAVGEEKTLKHTTVGDLAHKEWSISDSSIATIDKANGKVKGVKPGKVTVVLHVKTKSGKEAIATGELTVTEPNAEIKLEPATLTCKVGDKKTVKATVQTAKNKAVTWKSSDETVLKIVESKDDSCTFEALKAGKAVIEAASKENPAKTAKADVTVQLKDGTALLKDKNGNQLYYKNGNEYKEATAADYYVYEVFYRKKDTTQYLYTGWQNLEGKRYYFDKNGKPVTGEQIIQGMKYSFNTDGSLQVNGTMGIDVSKHNGSIDWNAVKSAGVDYAIIRCGYRGSATGVLVEDQMFKSNIQGAQAAGIKVGIYFFSQAVNDREALEEASLTLDLIRKYKITYPVFMDVEAANGRADGMDAASRTQVIRTFCETIRGGGYTAGVYANKTWLSSKMNVGSLGSYRIWLAQYAAAPTYGGRYEMWQYSSTGRISGIGQPVDLNISYMSY